MLHWIVMKTDSAILGYVKGEQTQETIAGPYDTYEEALEARKPYRRHGCTWYAIVKSEHRPADTSKNYEFVDAAREFDDVW